MARLIDLAVVSFLILVSTLGQNSLLLEIDSIRFFFKYIKIVQIWAIGVFVIVFKLTQGVGVAI